MDFKPAVRADKSIRRRANAAIIGQAESDFGHVRVTLERIPAARLAFKDGALSMS